MDKKSLVLKDWGREGGCVYGFGLVDFLFYFILFLLRTKGVNGLSARCILAYGIRVHTWSYVPTIVINRESAVHGSDGGRRPQHGPGLGIQPIHSPGWPGRPDQNHAVANTHRSVSVISTGHGCRPKNVARGSVHGYPSSSVGDLRRRPQREVEVLAVHDVGVDSDPVCCWSPRSSSRRPSWSRRLRKKEKQPPNFINPSIRQQTSKQARAAALQTAALQNTVHLLSIAFDSLHHLLLLDWVFFRCVETWVINCDVARTRGRSKP